MDRLRALRLEVDLRIAKLERSIAGLATLCGEAEEKREGLTDAVRSILKTSDEVFTPTQVRDELRRSGFDVDRYENPLAAIHTTLKRIASRGEATIVMQAAEARAYRWTQNDPYALEARRQAGAETSVVEFLDEYVRKRA
jgi:hypothetical protein